MAMVVGLIAGKRVVSCLPPSARNTVPLPHREIEDMGRLINPAVSKDLFQSGTRDGIRPLLAKPGGDAQALHGL